MSTRSRDDRADEEQTGTRQSGAREADARQTESPLAAALRAVRVHTGAAHTGTTELEEKPAVRHNQLGETYSVKLVYPSFYHGISAGEAMCSVGFPSTKEKLAKRIPVGHMFFIYVTSPERRIIGLTRAFGPATFAPERDFRRPWLLDLLWVLGPRTPGVRLAEVGLHVKPRVGDSTYAVADEAASAIIEKLEDMPCLEREELQKQRERYRMYL